MSTPKLAMEAAEPTAEFLSKFKAMIQMKAKDGDISDDDVKAIFKSARGYAGGKGKARKRAESMMSESYEEKRREIQTALGKKYPSPNGYSHGRYDVMETYDDHVIACDYNTGEYFSIPYMINGDKIEFGDLVEVKQEWEEASENGGWRIFNELGTFAEPPDWIPLMPKPGEFSHPEYGKIEITTERNEHFIQNFKDAVYQTQLPINSEHKPDEQGAYGWITDMRLNADGSIDGKTQWTDLGEEAIRKDRFKYISPEWFDEWKSKSTGEKHKDVLSGAALTVRPFFKEDSLRPLVANEAGLSALEDSRNFKPKGRITGVWNEGPTTWTMTAFEPIKTEVKKMAEPEKKEDKPTVVKGMSEDETKQFTELKTLVETQTQQMKTMGEQLTAKDTELKAATEQVKTMREDMRRTRFRELAKDFHGDKEAHVKFLERLADSDEKGEESDLFKAYVEREKGLAEQVKTNKLFEEVGHDGDLKTASAISKIEAEAKKLREADPALTEQAAFTKAMEQNPKLYAEYRAENQ